MASDCMECVEGRAVALGLCADCLAGEPVEAVVRQIARLARELEEARERVRRVRSAVIRAAAALVRLDLRWDPREEAEWVRRESVVKIATRLGDKVLALSTPQEAGGADCRCAPAAPWRSDGATCPDWPGCGSSDWRPATPQEVSEPCA